MLPVETPFKVYTGRDGKPLDRAYVYFGVANQNPITAPVTVYWDAAGTQPALQPLRTENGYIMRAGTPANVFVAGAYSEIVQDSKRRQVFYSRTSNDYSIADAILALFAAFGGSSLISYISSVAGSLKRSLQSVFREQIRLLDFIPEAEHAAILAHTSTYDASDEIISALAAAGALTGGGTVHASRGKFRCTKEIPFPNNVHLVGEGKTTTKFEFTHTGNGFVVTNPVNSSTSANIRIAHASIVCTNALNAGSAYVDMGSSYVTFERNFVQGFKYGVILDQSRHVAIDINHIIVPDAGIGVWITSGADYRVGSLPLFTNRIAITRNQFNCTAAAAYSVAIDGGVNQSIQNNNFNAGLVGIRAAGAFGLIITGNEMETHGSSDIYLADTTMSGTYAGPCCGFEIHGNQAISGPGSGYNIGIQNGRNGRISSNTMGQAAACISFVNGAANQATGVIIEGNTKLVTGIGRSSGIFVNGAARSIRNNIIRQTAVTYCASSALSGAGIVVTPLTMEFIMVGTRLHLENEDGTNGEDVIVTAVAATTFTATLASTKAANFTIYGGTPADQQEGSWTPVLVGSTTAGTNTYSIQAGQWFRRGNKVHAKGTIAISTKDAAMAGALSITGLPFTSEAVTNGNAMAHISMWGGFTMASGHTFLAGYVTPNTTSIGIRKSGSALALSTVPATDCPGATIDLYFDVTYLTSSL